jgi:hypothetical protein
MSGYKVLSDDCLVLEERAGCVLARPAYPGLRLWEDSLAALGCDAGAVPSVAHYTAKRRLAPPDQERQPVDDLYPLAGLYMLWRRPATKPEEQQVTVQPLSRREGFCEILPHLFRFNVTDDPLLRRQFDFLGRLVTCVPVRRLCVPNSFTALDHVRGVVITDVGAIEQRRLRP